MAINCWSRNCSNCSLYSKIIFSQLEHRTCKIHTLWTIAHVKYLACAFGSTCTIFFQVRFTFHSISYFIAWYFRGKKILRIRGYWEKSRNQIPAKIKSFFKPRNFLPAKISESKNKVVTRFTVRNYLIYSRWFQVVLVKALITPMFIGYIILEDIFYWFTRAANKRRLSDIDR